MNVKSRVHHEVSIHAQSERRFSYYNPPLGQLPQDLEDLYIPDPGWPWLSWDWDQMEPKLLCALCKDEQLTKEITEGWDRYTIFACMLFQLPMVPTPIDVVGSSINQTWLQEVGWKHKGDKRRKLAKNGVLALQYGKDPKQMMHMPGYRAVGIKRTIAIRAAQQFLSRYPRMLQWRRKVAEHAIRYREVRDFMGARWCLLETNEEALKRKAYNGPMQMGVSSIHNTVMVQIKRAYGSDVLWKKGKHDAQTWAIREEAYSTIVPGIREIVEQEWDIEGTPTRFSAVFEETWG